MRELIIDIETAPLHKGLEGYSPTMRDKLTAKYPDDGFSKAGLHAEYGRIVCISAGYWKGVDLKVKSYYDEPITTPSLDNTEKVLLQRFAADCGKGFKFIGHNILDFDLPFIQRRMVLNGVEIPSGLQTAGKKPWDLEAQFADTMVMWSGTQWKYRVSLAVLCELLGVESPKSDMDGSQVGEAFYRGEIDRIAKYCERDVVATAKVYQILKSRGM